MLTVPGDNSTDTADPCSRHNYLDGERRGCSIALEPRFMKMQPNHVWRSQQGLRASGVEDCGADSGACTTALTLSVHDIFNFL